jgi:hypothetical protein
VAEVIMKNRSKRIEKLEAEIVRRGGVFGGGEGMDPDLLEEFLEDVLDFDDMPSTTLRERLTESGPLLGDLWGLLERLADINVVVEMTDHLSDAELLEYLQSTLDEPMVFPSHPDTVTHLEAGSSEDEGIYLRYYADDMTRAEWQRASPETPIPPKEKPPYDRDRLMPEPRRDREMAAAAGGN